MEILQEFNKTVNVLGAFVLGDQGLMASTLPQSIDHASIISAGNGILRTMQGIESTTAKKIDEITIKGANGTIVARNLEKGCLCVVCTGNVNLALINLTLGAVSKSVNDALAAEGARPVKTRTAGVSHLGGMGSDAMAKLRATLGGKWTARHSSSVHG